MKKYFKKEHILILFIFVSILSTIIIKPLGDLDEIWNYNVARNMALGKIPYKEISTITTPLLPAINSIFLNIFDELIVMRILAAILLTSIFYMIFKILRYLTKETNISLILTLLLAIIFPDVFCIDYNYMILLLSLIIVYIELKNKSQYKKNNIVVGILAGLAICTKQSIGGLIAIATVLNPILELRKKENIKEIFNNSLMRIIGISIPCLILLIYLLATKSFAEFINYAILSISTFDNKIPYKNLFENKSKVIVILARLMPIIISTLVLVTLLEKFNKKIKNTDKKNNNNIKTLTIYGITMLVIMYPIADKIHFLIGSAITLIGISYLIINIGKKVYEKINSKNKRFIYKTTTLVIYLLLIIIIANKSYTNISEYKNMYDDNSINKKIAHYKYINIPSYLEERIKQIDEYILKKEKEDKIIYILDAEAGIYHIPLNKYIKNYDMFLKGNIGKAGEKGIIEELKKQDKSKTYLVRKNEDSLNWQTPTKVIKYIKENYEKIGEISIYDEYIKK